MKLMALAMLLVTAALMSAQEVASITGTVTDTTGAVVQGASVVLLNTRTNTKYEATTNETGLYTISKVLPGPGYKLTFVKNGFEKVSIVDLYLTVSTTRTQNVQMKVGGTAETVEVSAVSEGVALNTTDATVATNFNMNSVSQLPVQIRDSPAALLTLQPGVVSATGGSDGLGSRAGSVTGARGDQNNVTLDGLDVNDFATGQAFSTVANAPVDSIQEFRGETVGSLSASGRGSGGQVNMVTKSGTNTFHGSAAEYNRTAATAANTWFNNNGGVKKAPLTRNQFGATIGGPVIKDKLFFFFNYNGRREAYASTVNTTVPLDSFRNGTIQYIKATDSTGAACANTSRANTTPGCIGTLTAAQVAAMDPQGIGMSSSLLQYIAGRYPHANDLTGGDGVNTGTFRFNAPVHRTSNDYVGKLDWTMSNSMKVFGRFSILRDQYGDSVNYAAPMRFPDDPLTKAIANASYSYVVGHTWTISNTKINQFTYGKTVSDLSFPTLFNPVGTTVWTFSPLTSPYYNQSNQARVNPIPVFRDDFTWQKGNHNIQFGGTFKPILTNSALVNDNNFVTAGLGGNLSSLDMQGANPYRPADLLQDSGAIANSLYDGAFTFGLGHIGQVQSQYNYNGTLNPLAQGSGAHRQYRYYEYEGYAQDSWKFRSNLTLNFGLRYQYYSVPYEVNGQEAIQNLGFNDLIFKRAADGLAGIGTDTNIPFTVYTLGGKANNARGLYAADRKNFAPRLSFSWNPKGDGALHSLLGDSKTVIRGGAGIVYDHPVTNALNFIQDQNSYMFQASTTKRYGSTPTAALTSDPRFTSITSIPTPNTAPAMQNPYTPFVSAGVPYGTADGEFNYAIDPNLKTPYAITFNLGFQRELPGHFVWEATYVGRLGRRLMAQADAAQLVQFVDPTSGQTMSQAFAGLTADLRAGKRYNSATLVQQPFFNNQVASVGGLTGTQVVAGYQRTLTTRGDMADVVQWLAANGLVNSNLGLAAQFAGNTYITNLGNSNYHGLLTSLHRNFANGLQFDINYTFSHSIDNASGIANSIASVNGMGFVCDALNPRTCRGNSDFDISHIISGNFIYELPFGKGKQFGGSASGALNHVIGGWSVSGVPVWRSGIAWSTVSGAYLMGYANNAPAIFNGNDVAAQINPHKLSNNTVNIFDFPTDAFNAFSGPIGFDMGSRNNLRGPRYFNLDLRIAKKFTVTERVLVKFEADAYNSLNNVNFALPGGGGSGAGADITSGVNNFGKITSTVNAARVMQFGLRLEF